MCDRTKAFTVPQDVPEEQTQLLVVESLRELQIVADGVFKRVESSILETEGIFSVSLGSCTLAILLVCIQGCPTLLDEGTHIFGAMTPT